VDGLPETLTARAPYPGALAPSYDGHGLVNVAATVLRAFGVHTGAPPAAALEGGDLLRGVKRIALVLVDGLGHDQLRAAMAKEGLALADAARAGSLSAITTVAPSTTTSAIASACTAAPPLEHGLLGYRLFLKEYACLANMIRFAPILGGAPFDTRGVEPRSFLTAPTLFERLRSAGVPATVLTRKDYIGSALSRMVHHGADTVGFAGQGDFAVHLRRALETMDRGYVFAYWDLLDSVSHRYGTLTPEHLAELALLDHALDREVLSRKGDGGTLLLLTADHGHINIPPANRVDLSKHPDLTREFLLPPAGEPRYLYLYLKHGREAAARAYLEKEFGGEGAVFTAAEAVERGYFGPGPAHPSAADRLGDLHLVPTRDNAFLYPFPGEKGELIGRHGGFSREEMLVPLLAVRL